MHLTRKQIGKLSFYGHCFHAVPLVVSIQHSYSPTVKILTYPSKLSFPGIDEIPKLPAAVVSPALLYKKQERKSLKASA